MVVLLQLGKENDRMDVISPISKEGIWIITKSLPVMDSLFIGSSSPLWHSAADVWFGE